MSSVWHYGARAALAAAACSAVITPVTGAQASPAAFAIIPRPVRLTPRPGRFVITPRTIICTDALSEPLGARLARDLEPAMGWRLAVRTGVPPTQHAIVLRRDRRLARLRPEGYVLEVRPNRITARAPDPAGLFYAEQTIRQLLPPEVFREAPVGGAEWTIPAVSIEDAPRFRWRGAHLDVARHFMPESFVKRYIDLLALHKLNTFHWHLTDDQGWRIEIMRYPRLTEVGAWRKATVVGRMHADSTQDVYDGRRYGGYYTQEDIREIVAYARERFVTVVPEIEMPGHSQAAIASYPGLGNRADTIEVWTRWDVSENTLTPEDETIRFIEGVLAEVLTLFPGPYIHIGGDEAPKTQWEESPRVQARMRELGLANAAELQSWFIRQIDAFLTARGRRLVGWDEILEGGAPPHATVMSWRGTAGGIAAARAGHDVVMAPQTPTYLDHYQSLDRGSEPLAIGGYNPIDSVYAFEPVPPQLESQFTAHILGAQGQVWTEYIGGPREVEYMAFPRLCALAEVVWTPPERKDFADFTARLETHLRRLDALDVGYRRPDR